MKSRAFDRQFVHFRRARLLKEKDRNSVLADSVKQLSDRLVAQIGEIRPIERHVIREPLRQIETERDFALKPRLDRVPISGDHLGCRVVSKCGYMLIEDLSNQRSV